MTSVNFGFICRNLFRQQRRVALSLLTLAGGVTAFLLAGGFIHWIFDDMRELTIQSQLGHIQITRPGYMEQGIADPYAYLLDPDDRIPVSAELSERVRTITPRLAFSGLISKDENTLSFIGEGVDAQKESAISRAFTIVSGTNLDSATPYSAVLGEGLAANLDARPGDSIILLATAADGSMNAVELEIVGLFATITKSYDDTVLRVPIEVARQLMKVEGATTWVVQLHNTRDTEKVIQTLAQVLPLERFEIIPWFELADFYNKTVELFTKQVDVVRLLIAIIIVLSISNTLSMTVIERTSEIGTAMALGVRRLGILSQFIWEGTLLGIAGGVVGVLSGFALAEIISMIGIPMPPAPGMARGYTAQISISPALALDAFMLAFGTTLLASIFPAWKASRMNIVDALRHQR